MKNLNIPNIFHETFSDTIDEKVPFYITNNGCSSSILELETHKKHHPDVVVSEKREVFTNTVDNFLAQENIDVPNFWCIDVQGAELKY